MRALKINADLVRISLRTVWFRTPEEAVADPVHLIAHVLTYGTHEDVETLRRYVCDEELSDAIRNAPPGIFDPRSWAYWNLKIGRYPAPPLPTRTFE